MRILAVHNHYQRPGGEDAVFAAETALLESAGHEVVRFTRRNDDVERMSRREVVAQTFWSRDSADRVAALIEAHRPHVMHCHNTFPLVSPSVYRTARGRGVGVVQTLHNYRPLCPKAELMRNAAPCEACLGRSFAWPAIRHACYRGSRAQTGVVAAMTAFHRARGTYSRDVDRYVTPTAFVRGRFVAGGFPAERVVAKPNFVPHDPGMRDGPAAPGEGGDVVFVGRLSPEKGLDVLLDAWSRLAAWGALPPGSRLRVLGDGPLAEDVQAAAAQDPRIEWLGHRPREAVMDAIGAARVLVMPSVWYETFGLCIAEAFACGTPVVASRLGAMAELVEHGRTGFLFAPGAAQDLADTLVRAFAADLAEMRRAARARYEAEFSAEANLPLLLRIYEEAIAARGATLRRPGTSEHGHPATPSMRGSTIR